MLIFSTILNIKAGFSKEDFIQLLIDWNRSSPYESNRISDLTWHGERTIRFGNDSLWLSIEELRAENILAARFEKVTEDGVIWDTDYVMNFFEMRMAIRLDRSFSPEALQENEAFSTPHFISMLIEKGYLEDDGALPVGRTPILIHEAQMPLLTSIFKGECTCRLPIVYISNTSNGKTPVDVNYLASKLKGVAHVLVQGDVPTETVAAHGGETNGAIGLYYPAPGYSHKQFRYYGASGFDSYLFDKVFRIAVQFSNSKMMPPLYTWQGVNNALLLSRMQFQLEARHAAEQAKKDAEEKTAQLLDSLSAEEQRIRKQALEDAKHEANKLLESFDDELDRMREQVAALTRENEALVAENQGLRARLDALDQVPILCFGDEYEFYPGEIKDLILSVLTDAAGNLPPQSRRMDVAKDILDHNDYQEFSKQKAETVMRLLKSYDRLNAPLRQALIDLGFEITEEGKHYKLTYFGDDRYQAIIAKTPSDVRSGKNDARDIIRRVF